MGGELLAARLGSGFALVATPEAGLPGYFMAEPDSSSAR